MDVTLRPFVEEDAPALSAAVADSLAERRPWMPWAGHEPLDPRARVEDIEKMRADEAAGVDWIRGIWVAGDLAGSCGLHDRLGGGGGLEIGYWVRTGWTRRGIARNAVTHLCDLALAMPAIDHVEIHHDLNNTASGAVARAAGFTHIEDHHRDPKAPADGDTECIWRLTRERHPAELSASAGPTT
jgi:ribosomal-protein-serine acetyltransferase